MLFASCFSYRPHNSRKSARPFEQPERQTVFVTNQAEFSREYKILRKSGLYNITQDTSAESKIKLNKMTNNTRVGCVTGQVMVMCLFLGQYPVTFPESYTFTYELIANKELKVVEYDVALNKRIWFWDLLSVKKSRNKVIARQLTPPVPPSRGDNVSGGK
jgi:hypothetical protein